MLLKVIKIALIAAFFVVSISAQPRGDEPQIIRKMVSNILDRISETDQLIAKKPKAAELYGKRASLYIELYLTLYRKDYLSSFYGEKPPEFSVSAISSKAIADFSKAINLSPRVEWFSARGEMYALRWNDFVYKFNWYDEIKNFESVEWRDLIAWQTPEKELKIFEKFLRNPDFSLALSDYKKVLNLSEDKTLLETTHQNIARLYMRRVGYIFYERNLNKNLLVQQNQFGYLIFNEIYTALKHISLSNIGNEYRRTYSNNNFINSPLTLRHTLFDKAVIAAFYNKNDLAIAALNEAEKYVDKTEKNDEFICSFYPLRSSLYSKIGKFDAALADANVKNPNTFDTNIICYNAYEPRGDAFFGKGEFASAIADYTSQISKTYDNSDVPSLYKKRGIAYMKLGETEKAVADFTYSINHGTYFPEFSRLRAQAYRALGDNALAADDEKKAQQSIESNERMAIKRAVYGKIIMPDGMPVELEKISLHLSYIANPTKNSVTSVDEQGRFLFTNMPEGDFKLFAYFDGMKDGIAVRFYGLSDKMNIENKLVGPITLKLDRTVKLAKQPTN